MVTRESDAMAHAQTDHARSKNLMAHDLVAANGVPVDRARAAQFAAAPRSGSSARSVVWTALVVDVVMITAAVVTAGLLTGAGREPFFWFVAFGGLALALLYKKGLYDWRVRVQVLDDLRGVVTVTLLAITTILSLRVVLGATDNDVAAQSLHVWAFAAAYLAAGRVALGWSRLQDRREGDNAKSTLIIGAGKIGHLVANRLLEHPEFGLRPIGFLDKEPLDHAEPPVPILGASWDLEQVIEEHGVDHVVVAFSTAPSDVLLRQIQRCEEAGIGISLVPRLYEYMTDRATIEHIGGLPLVSPRRIRAQGWQFSVKYAVDRAAAATLLVLLSPLLAILAVGTALSVGRPVLFRQTRVGLGGREFEIYKFRTMTHMPAEAPPMMDVLMMNVAPGGVEGADRRTRFGSIMRRLSLDELPQLINVVKGDMSLIGPRPERPQFVEIFVHTISRYEERHRVKPGITGWAQIHGLRGKTSLTDRVEWDNYYLENWSLWLDLKILVSTLFVVGQHSKQTE
jgi:exopolysaccharide biosynthesis polyprenyl glycosylphosphotransferase